VWQGCGLTTLVVLQPSYLPWLGYFDQMRRADFFVWYDDVQFDKNGWRNRNRIKGPKGPLWLTVPVRHKGRALQPINAVEIDDHQSWRRKHLLSVEQLYARAPFCETILPRLAQILNQPWDRLVDLDIAATDWMAGELAIDTPRFRASQLNVEGDRNGRLIDLCRHFRATRYLSGDSARDYLDVGRFQAAGIEVIWHSYQHPSYPQLHGDFVPYLSAVDLLLNVGPTAHTVLSK
jgi:WbqC-like protein family